jgi:hypothetical protein
MSQTDPNKNIQTKNWSLSEAAINFAVSALIWLFGVLVFIPIAKWIDPYRVPVMISLLVFFSFTIFFLRGLANIGPILNYISNSTCRWWYSRKGVSEEQTQKYRIFTKMTKVTFLIIIYLLYLPIVSTIHPALNGISLIISIFGIVVIIIVRK